MMFPSFLFLFLFLGNLKGEWRSTISSKVNDAASYELLLSIFFRDRILAAKIYHLNILLYRVTKIPSHIL